ncbi:MAG: PKD domain-containing protein [Gammaproteobacteria bacterium]|nr:PKD domain-containing protein [Gammaproteobacteria bacterium]
MRISRIGLYLFAFVLSACGSSNSPNTESEPSSNQPPSAAFTASPTSGSAPLFVAFDASSSSDPDGVISIFKWDFGDGQSAFGQTFTHTYSNIGDYPVRLTVTDNDGGMDDATLSIGVFDRVSDVRVQWDNNRESGVHQRGGGYRVYYDTRSGFDLNNASLINVPNVSGLTPRSTVISLPPGRYYFNVVAYTALNTTGSEASQEISITVQ